MVFDENVPLMEAKEILSLSEEEFSDSIIRLEKEGLIKTHTVH